MSDTSAVATRSNTMPAGQFVALVEKFKDLDPANFKAFLDIYRDEQDRQALAEFNASYAPMLAEVGKVSKDKSNPLYRSRYSSYEAMMDALEPIRIKYGIGIYFGCEPTGNPETMRPYLELFKGLHRRRVCEQDIRITVEGPKGGRPAMNEMQAMGSAVTYVRKSFLQMAFNLVPSEDSDDDGNSARTTRPPPPSAKPTGPLTDHARQVVETKQNAPDPNRARIDTFLEGFRTQCKGATTQEAADAILKDQGIMQGSDWLNRNAKQDWDEFCRIRDEMISRVFA